MFKSIITLVKVVDGNLSKFLKLQFLIVLASIIELAMVVIIPFWFSANLTNQENSSILMQHVTDNKFYFGIVSVLIIIISSLLNIYVLYKSNLYSFSVGQNASHLILKKYLNESYFFHQKNNSSKLISNINAESLRLANFFLNPFFILNSKIIVVILIITFLVYYDPLITLSSILFFLFFYLIIFRFVRQKLKINGVSITEINSDKIKISEESISAFIEVNLYKLKNTLLDRFYRQGARFSKVSAETNLISKFPKYLIELLLFCTIILIISNNSNSDGVFQTIIVFGFAAYKILPYIQQIFSTYTVMRANFNSFEVLESDLINSSTTKTNFFKTDDLKKLSLENINFSYSNKKLFNNFSYEFKVGKIYGLVGESGAGKSSLLKIIMGFISPNSGKVKINDKPILDSWLKDVAYVSQQNIILNVSLGQNIDINYNGNEKMRIKIINLLKSLGLKSYLEEIDYNLDHILNEKGSNISGGQLQRISIARALYIESKLIIFDEATSALDNHNQELLMNILKKLVKKSIVIISTHRKETLDFCDFIIKL